MKRKVLSVILILFFTGCTQAKQIAHMEELLKLKNMSESRDEQENFVAERNKQFDQLVATVKADQLKDFADKQAVLKTFGEPVIVRPVVDEGKPSEQWLYRYATQYFKTDKVYLYFDAQGKLGRWEYVPAAPETAQIPTQ